MNWRKKISLVTGGAGLVGSHIVKKLVQRGATIKVLDNLSAYPFDQIIHFLPNQEGVEFIKGDITDKKVVDRALVDVDVVFHEAAFADVAATIWNPEEDFRSNVLGTFNLLKSSKDNCVDRFIFASSAAVYGEQPKTNTNDVPMFSEDMKPNPISTYANSKLWGEYEAQLFTSLYGLKTTSLRYFSIYGEPQVPKKGSHSWVVAIFVMRLLKNKPLVIFGDGSQVRDFIHVDDVAEATILAAEKQSTINKVINIGTGKPTTIKLLADNIFKIANLEPALEYIPRPKGDPFGGYANIKIMKKTIEWEPKINLKYGIERYYQWARSHKNIIPQWL
ncbi:MAG: NAD-dependent epimerase/dehydratase family protein [Candidatus Hodarchaeota archaeon]